jgi:hypothetical protein
MHRTFGLTAVALAILAGISLASCGVRGGTPMDAIDPADVPFGLGSTSSTTTTSTTTTLPPTTVPFESSTTTSVFDTTTSSTVATERRQVYFASGNRLRGIGLDLTAGVSASQLRDVIVAGPDALGELLGFGLRPLIPDTAEIGVSVEEGVAVIDIPQDVLDEIAGNDQRLLFGQFVLTILGGVAGIGQVTFTVAGEPFGVYLGDGSRGEPGQRLVSSDYQELLSDVEPPPVSTSTTVPATAPTNAPDVGDVPTTTP